EMTTAGRKRLERRSKTQLIDRPRRYVLNPLISIELFGGCCCPKSSCRSGLRQKSRYAGEDNFIAIPDRFENLRGIQRWPKTCNRSQGRRINLFIFGFWGLYDDYY